MFVSLTSSYIGHAYPECIAEKNETLRRSLEQWKDDYAHLPIIRNSLEERLRTLQQLTKETKKNNKRPAQGVNVDVSAGAGLSSTSRTQEDVSKRRFYCSVLVADVLGGSGIMSLYKSEDRYVPADFSSTTMIQNVFTTKGYTYTEDKIIDKKKLYVQTKAETEGKADVPGSADGVSDSDMGVGEAAITVISVPPGERIAKYLPRGAVEGTSACLLIALGDLIKPSLPSPSGASHYTNQTNQQRMLCILNPDVFLCQSVDLKSRMNYQPIMTRCFDGLMAGSDGVKIALIPRNRLNQHRLILPKEVCETVLNLHTSSAFASLAASDAVISQLVSNFVLGHDLQRSLWKESKDTLMAGDSLTHTLPVKYMTPSGGCRNLAPMSPPAPLVASPARTVATSAYVMERDCDDGHADCAEELNGDDVGSGGNEAGAKAYIYQAVMPMLIWGGRWGVKHHHRRHHGDHHRHHHHQHHHDYRPGSYHHYSSRESDGTAVIKCLDTRTSPTLLPISSLLSSSSSSSSSLIHIRKLRNYLIRYLR
jgi:hypothetical protein